MRNKRMYAASLATLMAATALTACGGSQPAATTAAPAAAATTAAPAATETQVAPNAETAGQALKEEQKVNATTGEVQKGGILTVSMPSSPRTLDPKDYSTMYENHIMYNIMETLFIWNGSYEEVIPYLVEDDYTISEDGLEYHMKLKDGIKFGKGKFQDGREVTAEDVKFSLERCKELCATDRICRDFFDYVEVVNDKEFIIHMSEAAGPLLFQLADMGNCILPKEEVEGWGEDFGNHAVGTGAFLLKEIVTDESVTLEKNPEYWGVEPNVDGIKFVINADSNQAFNAVETGEVDIAMYLQGEAIKRSGDAGNLLQIPASAVTYVRFNECNGPTADVNVRKALTMAVDIDALVQGIYQYGEGARAYQPLTVYSFAYNPEFNNLVPAYDPEGAKALLKEAGYGDGFDLSIYIASTQYREKMAQMLQYYWGEIGVNLNIKSSTMAEWSAAVVDSWQADAVSMYGVSWNSNPDPYGFLEKFYSSKTVHASSNAGGHSDPELDEIFHKAFGSADQDERIKLYGEAMEKIMNEYTGIFYASECRNWAVSSKVHDVILRADSQVLVATPFNNIWKEQ